MNSGYGSEEAVERGERCRLGEGGRVSDPEYSEQLADMRCTKCLALNAATRRFCAECGAPLASACPACGFENALLTGRSRHQDRIGDLGQCRSKAQAPAKETHQRKTLG